MGLLAATLLLPLIPVFTLAELEELMGAC